MRWCPWCSQNLDESAFNRNKAGKDGLEGVCRKCKNAQRSAWRKANRDKVKAAKRRYKERHPDKVKEMYRRRYIRNLDKITARLKTYREKNREKVLLSKQKHYIKNKAAYKARSRAWRKRNRNKIDAAAKRAKERLANAPGVFTQEQLRARIAYYGNCCAYCGGSVDTIDHVIPLTRGGSNWPANLRPACSTCNSSKNAKTPREWEAYKALEAEVLAES